MVILPPVTGIVALRLADQLFAWEYFQLVFKSICSPKINFPLNINIINDYCYPSPQPYL